MDSVEEIILECVEEITFKKVAIDEPLYTTNIIDSMGTVDLAVLLQQRFDITIDASDIIEDNFNSVALLKAYIQKRLDSE